MSIFFPDKIIVHHSLTVDSGTVSWGAIRKYHIQTLGMSDIGYHAGIELVKSGDENYYEALLGRPWDKRGAHTLGENERSLGICFVGNYDEVIPTDAMLLVGARVIAYWMKIYAIFSGEIYPHSKFADKTCPGTKFPLDKLISMVTELVTDA